MYQKCILCERKCGIDRTAGQCGFCKASNKPVVARAALHFWEEPIISGNRGSGAIFFAGCSLGCIYCQNREISIGEVGQRVEIAQLSRIMLDLESRGAHNINLVTPTHFVPSIALALDEARTLGLKIPIVYNTGTYESEECLDILNGRINIYLPDMKYYRPSLAKKYSNAENLPQIARRNIDIMFEQVGNVEIDNSGLMTSGVVVRLLVLPGAVADTKLNIKYLHKRYGNKIYISLMSQYTPISNELQPPLNRRVAEAEYSEVVDYALKIGVEQAFIQDRASAKDVYIPAFDGTGVVPEKK